MSTRLTVTNPPKNRWYPYTVLIIYPTVLNTLQRTDGIPLLDIIFTTTKTFSGPGWKCVADAVTWLLLLAWVQGGILFNSNICTDSLDFKDSLYLYEIKSYHSVIMDFLVLKIFTRYFKRCCGCMKRNNLFFYLQRKYKEMFHVRGLYGGKIPFVFVRPGDKSLIRLPQNLSYNLRSKQITETNHWQSQKFNLGVKNNSSKQSMDERDGFVKGEPLTMPTNLTQA